MPSPVPGRRGGNCAGAIHRRRPGRLSEMRNDTRCGASRIGQKDPRPTCLRSHPEVNSPSPRGRRRPWSARWAPGAVSVPKTARRHHIFRNHARHQLNGARSQQAAGAGVSVCSTTTSSNLYDRVRAGVELVTCAHLRGIGDVRGRGAGHIAGELAPTFVDPESSMAEPRERAKNAQQMKTSRKTQPAWKPPPKTRMAPGRYAVVGHLSGGEGGQVALPGHAIGLNLNVQIRYTPH